MAVMDPKSVLGIFSADITNYNFLLKDTTHRMAWTEQSEAS